MNSWISETATYHDHFKLTVWITAQGGGLSIVVDFLNKKLNNETPNIEIWLPIVGHVEYLWDNLEIVIGSLLYYGKLSEDGSKIRSKFYGLLKPNQTLRMQFYVKVPLEHAERMKEIAEEKGILPLMLYLQFSALYNQGVIVGQKTYNYAPIFRFDIPKEIIEEWILEWSSLYAQYKGLPKSVPKEVLDDYIEAVKAYNVGAYKATVAMARRALQQAVEDKEASKKKPLYEQINELYNQHLLDDATKNLAHGIRYFGNYGAHPQDDLLSQVTEDDARLAIEVLRQILIKLYGPK